MTREHEGRFGKFYSEWAFDEQSEFMVSRNHEVYDMLMGAIDCHEVSGERDHAYGDGEEEFVYRLSCYGYAHNDYCVIDMPEWMTMAEAALVIDRGNLCFGFRTGGGTVTIHID